MSIRINNPNPWRIWDPPVFPRPPLNTSSHYILPLKSFVCSQKFVGNLDSNPILCDKITPEAYSAILLGINLKLRPPLLWYILIKCGLTFVSFIASVSLIISLIFIDFLYAGVSAGVVLITFILIRESGNQYFKAMFRMKLKVSAEIEEISRKYLNNTDVKVFCGEFCNWIDFTTANQEIIEENPSKTFYIFTPGNIVPKGSTSLPLL